MNGLSKLSETETLCNGIMNSVYFRKQTPDELKQLRSVLDKVSLLVNDNVPSLIAEVKQLRNQNKRLRAEIEAFGLPNQQTQENLPS
jgi:hypothetical protein